MDLFPRPKKARGKLPTSVLTAMLLKLDGSSRYDCVSPYEIANYGGISRIGNTGEDLLILVMI